MSVARPPIPQSLDHIVLAVADLEAATAAHAALLGLDPSWRGSHPVLGTQNTLFRLDNTYLELLAAERAKSPLGDLLLDALGDRVERPFALALGVGDIDEAVGAARARGIGVLDPADGEGVDDQTGRRRAWRSALIDPQSVRGLRLLFIQHTSAAEILPRAAFSGDGTAACHSVDHAVIFTEDLDASHALWTGALGLAQQWRRDFPDRGTRNLGLELAGITIELIMRTDRSSRARPDVFWGLAYRVSNCELAVRRLRDSKIDVDDPRDGLAPGTRVATVRWSRTPTLLIAKQVAQPPPRPPS